MITQRKNKFKPIFKKYIRLRENIQNREKVLKFKKEKWASFIKFYRNKLKRSKRKFKALDQSKYFVTKYGNRGTSYTRRFRDSLQAGKKLRIFYGDLLAKHLKKKIRGILRKKKSNLKVFASLEKTLIDIFESRLDTVLYRSKFAPSMRSAKQLILHGKIYVNNKKVKNKAYSLKEGDVVNLDLNCINLYESNIVGSMKWPIPPKHLLINYKTLQILFLSKITSLNLAHGFLFNLRLQKILNNYFRQ